METGGGRGTKCQRTTNQRIAWEHSLLAIWRPIWTRVGNTGGRNGNCTPPHTGTSCYWGQPRFGGWGKEKKLRLESAVFESAVPARKKEWQPRGKKGLLLRGAGKETDSNRAIAKLGKPRSLGKYERGKKWGREKLIGSKLRVRGRGPGGGTSNHLSNPGNSPTSKLPRVWRTPKEKG